MICTVDPTDSQTRAAVAEQGWPLYVKGSQLLADVPDAEVRSMINEELTDEQWNEIRPLLTTPLLISLPPHQEGVPYSLGVAFRITAV